MHGKTRRRWKKLIEMQEARGLGVKEFSRKMALYVLLSPHVSVSLAKTMRLERNLH